MPFKSEICFKKNGEPLSTYTSKTEAVDGAKHANTNYGLDTLPYKCSKCGYWHLSPKSRQTPSKECNYCTDSSGSHKDLYKTEEAAKNRAKIIEKEQGIKLKVYKCPYQNGWHLTKKIERKNGK